MAPLKFRGYGLTGSESHFWGTFELLAGSPPKVTLVTFGGSPKPIHLKPGHLKMAFFTCLVPSRQRLPCLDGASPV